MTEPSDHGWEGHLDDGQCPVQGSGRVDGYPWYFRARGDGWSMDIARDRKLEPEILPCVLPVSCPGWLAEGEWGVWHEAGYMDHDIAWQLITETIARFRAGEFRVIA